jgi:adenylate cyclase
MDRRQEAIFAADVVGYSRLMGVDEERTLQRLKALWEELVEPAIKLKNGRIIKWMGDGVLAAFSSAVDALECAVEIQETMPSREPELLGQDPLSLRIGINLGDVIVEGSDIFGDGVNLAARLEAAASSGGICISSTAYGAVLGKVGIEFLDGGLVTLKNIQKPVHVYYWPPTLRPDQIPLSAAKLRKVAQKPSVAVLPFVNMSGDGEQEYFVDGLTEDIIAALSRNRWYDVSSPKSTIAHKGQRVDPLEMARDLGVDFLLEGSVRKSGSRIRITAQLINARTSNHEWADRYDRELDDVFSVQDEITQRVASILSEAIWQSVAKTIEELEPAAYGPYEWCYSAIGLIHQLDPNSNELAKERLTKALELDPEVAMVHLGLGFCYLIEWALLGDVSGAALQKAHEHAEALRRLAPSDPHCYRLFSRIYTGMGKLKEAERCVDRALTLNPNDSDMILNKGQFLLQTGKFEDALSCFDTVLERHSETPHTVDIARLWKGLAWFFLGDCNTAVSILREISGLTYLKNLFLAGFLAAENEREESVSAANAALSLQPKLRLSILGVLNGFTDPEHRELLAGALRKAGIPD